MLSKEFESIKRYLNPIQTFNYQYFYIVLKKLFFEHNLFEMCTDDNATSEVLSECARIHKTGGNALCVQYTI